jgi:DNA polymerase-3 subunit gamma/tau
VHRVAVRLIRRCFPRSTFRVSLRVAYQVLARKWRPQRFDEVVGQQAVTRTLRNAIASGRIAQAFVFAGSRGCGKTTTARILAKALNCVEGPTPDPCGACDACVEIAQGRDIDVLEIDAASHTGIDNIREVVIAGLPIAPVRDRYKVFIIDEVHQLSTPSFNALLKSIEEPPAHVVFMMATTELHKIPDTILSRSQVFEFRTIPPRAIAAQLRRIAEAERIDVPDAALALIARAAEGSMRDAQSALDQVIAFAGHTVTLEDVSTVLGLVGRDLLLDLVDAVVEEDAPRAFALADRAVESGHDLRLVCRELSRVVRDMMMLGIDPDRAADGELDPEERERLDALGRRFSREDLLRAFDLLSKAEQEIRNVSHPRYYFEMVLLRWMHLRKLTPLVDLIAQLSGAAPAWAKAVAPTAPARTGAAPAGARAVAPVRHAVARPAEETPSPGGEAAAGPVHEPASASLKEALLAAIRSGKVGFYNTVVAQAQRIEVTADRVTFAFSSNQKTLRELFEQSRSWLEAAAERVAGRRITVTSVLLSQPQDDAPADPRPPASAGPAAGRRDIRAEALASPGVRALLDVFPAEIRDVEELE